MAGAGYKLFNTGDVLTAAQVNTYLMEQTVMVFADAAARTTALTGVVSEGMISYLKDTNAVEVYDGSSWVASDDPNAIQNSIVDAKGDLITATADNTPARLAVGANGTILTADSSTSTGLKWAAAAGGGKVLQVVGASTTSPTTITSTSLTDTGITATITPSSATSKILVMIAIHRKGSRSTAAVITGHSLLRGATEILGWGNNSGFGMEAVGSTAVQIIDQAPIIYLDSPATTSATTYKVQARVETSGESLVYQFGGKPSTVVLMEIGA